MTFTCIFFLLCAAHATTVAPLWFGSICAQIQDRDEWCCGHIILWVFGQTHKERRDAGPNLVRHIRAGGTLTVRLL